MDPKELGREIAALRKERGLTQRQLAERLGVTDKAVSRWERGVGYPDITLLAPLADALAVDLATLIGGGAGVTAPRDAAALPPGCRTKEDSMKEHEGVAGTVGDGMAEGDRKAGSGRARGRRETTLVTLRAHRRKLLVVAACVAAAAALVAAGLSGAFLPQVEVPWLVGTDAGAAYAALQEAGFTRIEGRKRAVGGDGVETSCDLSAETSGMTVIAECPDMGAVRTDTPITLVVESASEREKLESAQAEVAAWQERVSAMARELADWQSARRLSSTDVLQLEPRTTSGQSLASSLVALEDALSGYESGGMSDVDLELPDGLQQSSVTDDGGALFLEVACTWKDAAGATHDGVCKAKVVGAPLVRDDVVPAYAVLDLEIS